VWISSNERIGKSVLNKFKKHNIHFEVEDAGDETMLYFLDDDLKNVAKIVRPQKIGKSIDPYSNKNLPKK